MQALNFHRIHDTPFRKRASARGGSLPQPTAFAGKRKAPRVAGLMLPRRSLTEAAFANPSLRLISFEEIDLTDDLMDDVLHAPGETPDEQRNRNHGVVRRETGAG